MKTFSKNRPANHRAGYTLIELSVVMVLVVLIASTLVAMLNQQTQFLRWWRSQDFIAEEAPIANAMIVRLLSSANAFRVHETKAKAVSADTSIAAGASAQALSLGFTLGDGSRRRGILWFEGDQLKYGFLAAGSSTLADDDTWVVCEGMTAMTFNVVSGVLEITMTGPFGGRITYAATPSL